MYDGVTVKGYLLALLAPDVAMLSQMTRDRDISALFTLLPCIQDQDEKRMIDRRLKLLKAAKRVQETNRETLLPCSCSSTEAEEPPPGEVKRFALGWTGRLFEDLVKLHQSVYAALTAPRPVATDSQIDPAPPVHSPRRRAGGLSQVGTTPLAHSTTGMSVPAKSQAVLHSSANCFRATETARSCQFFDVNFVG